MLNKEEKLERIISLSSELTEKNDLDMVLGQILTDAREFLNADSGSIYVMDEDHLRFCCAQNDTLKKRLKTGEKLAFSSFTLPVTTETIAGYTAAKGVPVNIDDAYQLGDDTPYGFDDKYDKLSGYHTQSVLTVPLKNNSGKVVGVLQIINALDENDQIIPFDAESESLISYFGNIAAVALERAQFTRTLILRMISMAELRDPTETGPHVNRVGAYSVEVFERWARKRQMPEEEIVSNNDVLRMAAMLHDVGKIAIPDAILKKPAGLTDDEFAEMKQHSRLGSKLFISGISSKFEEAAASIALCHHENWDGTGYPGHIDVETGLPLPGYETADGARGKRGEEIPIFARIVKVADVYDALCSKRCYKAAMPEAKVLKILQEESGTSFDPDVVAALLESLESLRAISESFPDHSD